MATEFAADDGYAALQDLYRHLDHIVSGDRYMAYYGQLRAKGVNHADAMTETLDHFGIRKETWHQYRMNKAKESKS